MEPDLAKMIIGKMILESWMSHEKIRVFWSMQMMKITAMKIASFCLLMLV